MYNVCKNGIKISAGILPGQKKSSLYIIEGDNEYKVASFYSESAYNLFVDKMSKFSGIPVNQDDDED